MTDSTKGTGGPTGPPWSVDVLADLHAGALDPAESSRLWPQVNADPEARAVLDALASVQSDLGQLTSGPVEAMPAQYAAKLDAALQAEMRSSGRVATAEPPAPPVAPVIDLAAARKRRNRLAGWGAGVLAAAAAAIAVAVVVVPGEDSTGGTPQAQDDPPAQTETTGDSAPAPDEPLALRSDNLNSAIGGLTGEKDYGPLENQEGLTACLEALDIPAGEPLGVGQVTYEGQPGVAALLGAGEGSEPGRFRLVVVEPTCTADNPGEPLVNTELPS